jgi:uncharacterized protein (DUF342 family)
MRAAARADGPWLEDQDLDWTVQLLVSPDRLGAQVRVELRGEGKDCPPERILSFIDKCTGPLDREGVDQRVLQLSAVERQRLPALAEAIRHGSSALVASGQSPRPALREVRWLIDLEHKRPHQGRASGAAVDTHDVSHFVAVTAGQKLCEVWNTPAADGRDVFGDVIASPPDPTARAEPPLKLGEGVGLADDERTVIATRDGCVLWKGGTLSVIEALDVKGNVDFKIGNIDFNGEVAITGDVLPGFSVKASGAVKVGGMVEHASIDAGGSITIKGGVAGRNQAHLTAAGTIEARYLHMITVDSGDSVVIHTECLESQVTAARDVLAERGAIIGGAVRAKGSVRASLVGSDLGVATAIIAGRDNDAQKELQEAKRALERLHDLIVNDEHAIGLFANARGGLAALSPAKQQMVEVLQGQLTERQAAFRAQIQRVADLKATFAERAGTITVLQRVFPNVTLRIGEFSRTILTEQAGPMTFYPDIYKGTLEVRFK